MEVPFVGKSRWGSLASGRCSGDPADDRYTVANGARRLIYYLHRAAILLPDTFGESTMEFLKNISVKSDFGFWITMGMLEAIYVLAECAGGRFAAIMGYTPVGKDWTVTPVYDATFTSRFDTAKLYARKLEALQAITFEDVADAIAKQPKLSALEPAELLELFNARKAMEVASLLRTREDTAAHREGQARCHATVEDGLPNGVRVHYVTQKGADGLMHPVLRDGLPIAESIRVHALEQSRTYRQAGVRKVVNSGAPVLMGNAISTLLNKRSVGITSFTLRDNYEALRIDGATL
jgi:hypothetical protein